MVGTPGPRAVGALVGLALVLACTGLEPPEPVLFTDRPSEWLRMRGDRQNWEPYAVEESPGHYAEQIVIRRPPTDDERDEEVPEDERPRVFWYFRVERRVDFGTEDVAATVESFRSDLVEACAVVNWEKLYQTPEDAFYEWTHDGCGGSEPEHEIVRFVSGSLGVHRASLRGRGRRIPPELRNEWIKILSDARLVGSASAPGRR